MTRTVTDLAKLLDVMVGYDPEDPLTAMGVGHVPESYSQFLDPNGLRGARIGILRESMGFDSEPDSQDFAKVTAVFNRAVAEIQAAGATIVDPVVIPNLKASLAKRAPSVSEMERSFEVYFGRSTAAPFESFRQMLASPDFSRVVRYARNRLQITEDDSKRHQYLVARDELMIRFMKLMADNKLDAIVYKAVEHQPTLIEDGTGPPWVNTKGIPFLNTFLTFVPAIVVPAGFTTDNLPAGITFMAGPYKEGPLIKLAYAYEQATRYRKPPSSTPRLGNEP
jgi:Asp-tRNA(Asn)/Glu-tRNA(Gln) amidotransferase A subunit family amidase